MQDTFEDLIEKNITNLFTEKVKKDCIKLINEKNNNKNIEDLRKIKEGYLKENYVFLSKILGEPKLKFDYGYTDKNSNYIKHKNMTPLEFKNKFLSINLDDFVFLENAPSYDKDFYKLYRKNTLEMFIKKAILSF